MAVETLNNFGVWTSAGSVQRQMKQPVQQFRFSVELIGFGGTTGGQNLTLEAKTCSLPKESFDKVTINGGNSEVHIAGKRHWSDFSITCRDPIDGSVSKEIKAQLSAQSSSLTTAVATAATNYKFQTNVIVNDGSGKALFQYQSVGCWVVDADYGSFDYSSSETKDISLTIQPDNCVFYDSEGKAIDSELASSMLKNVMSTGGLTLP